VQRAGAAGHGRTDTAAAGLWSTAGDLARALLALRDSHQGLPGALLTRESAAEMLAAHPDSLYGLGTLVDGTGSDTEYGHGGTAPGYHAVAAAGLARGSGLVVLTNADTGPHVVRALSAEPGHQA
ncbi:beta-lactamase family protein, partial [Streptomyces sp. LS1784]|uniref:beta-lactamase family protein n=1 Tax=Streptomyces sp. LS1784 TaxID=2851533 RepID=UPI001CCAD17D